MKKILIALAILSGILPAAAASAQAVGDTIESVPTGSFRFRFLVQLPGDPDEVFAAATGDVSGWWDHSMSDDPVSLTIEPVPGGHFLEIMDESGGGVVHATVTQIQADRMLRMVGPMGLAGHAIHMVTTWTLEPSIQGGTNFTVEVHAAGEVHEGWPEIVERTWRHFIEGRLKPYLEKELDR